MTMRVFSSLPASRGAIAELPATVSAADSPEGAIVVLDGARGWWDDAILAVAAGAAGVLVSGPSPAPSTALDRLIGIPTVLVRPLLRPDVADDVIAAAKGAAGEITAAEGAAAAVVVECHAPTPALPGALRDALGWARIFASAKLTLRMATFGGGRGLALLDAGGAASVSLILGASAGAPPAGRLRVTELGQTRRELEVDEGDVRFSVTDASSRRLAPTRFERPERLALRRLAAALDARQLPEDLADYARDSALAEAILHAAADRRPESFTS